MAQQKARFTFSSDSLPQDSFHVVRFHGTEGLSRTYQFDITLVSAKEDLDLSSILSSPARFTIKRDQGDAPFHGVLNMFEQMQRAGGLTFYRTVLVPQFWRLTLTRHNQIFLNKTNQQFLTEVLKDGGLSPGSQFEFRLQKDYPKWEYVCQYNESHFDFASRWMERDGLYYYFEQTDSGEKLVVTDTAMAHAPMSGGETLQYAPPSGLDAVRVEEVVTGFMLRMQPVPKGVLLKDYNYRTPSLDMESRAQVSDKGVGEVYIYGEHFKTPSEGDQLAQVRAEELRCREHLFLGESMAPFVRTGYVFSLERHYQKNFNQRYLTIEATHEGSQEAYLTTGLGLPLRTKAKERDALFYRNKFACIPATIQFRAPRITERPRFHGVMNAKIDAAGSGKYAELDDQGRYKVCLPLDDSDRKNGKASCWLRMAQPYAGSDHGMHFPLHKGTEVLLTCVDGDPDRPIIAAAVPNPETPSVVKDADQTMAKLTTSGGNKIHMEDQEGSQRMLFQTPTYNTFLRLGMHNDPPASAAAAEHKGSGPADEPGEWGYNLHSDKGMKITAGGENTMILGEKWETVVLLDVGTKLAASVDVVIGLATELVLGGKGSYHFPTHWKLKGSEEKVIETGLETHGAKLAALGTYNVVHGQHGKVTATVTAVSAEATKAVADSNEVKVAAQAACANSIKAVADDVKTVATKTEAHGNKISAIGSQVNTVANSVWTAASHLITAGTIMQNSGTVVKSAATHIKNAGLEMRDAPVIMDA